MAIPIITAAVTLLPSLARGRMGLHAGTYRPHLVVDGDDAVVEHYMGVAFVGGPQALAPGEGAEVQLALVYFPNVDYRSLHAGCTFSIREGGTTVERGTVLLADALELALAQESSTSPKKKSATLPDRKARLQGDLAQFMRMYARKVPRHSEPNDRNYDRNVEQKVRSMRPEQLSDLLREDDEDNGAAKDALG